MTVTVASLPMDRAWLPVADFETGEPRGSLHLHALRERQGILDIDAEISTLCMVRSRITITNSRSVPPVLRQYLSKFEDVISELKYNDAYDLVLE